MTTATARASFTTMARETLWKPYVYRGTGRDELTPWMDAIPVPRELQPCGTEAAYARHLKYGEPTDEACRKAHRAHKNKNRMRT
jgi:hypothetical protein